MNRWDNISECLDSLRCATVGVSCEIIVVAYKFSSENLEKLCSQYPEIKIIESHVTRGFSENNNLALRQAVGKYCFVINDDTVIKRGCIDTLIDSFSKLPDTVAVVSPLILNPDGTIQWNGRPPISFADYMLGLVGCRRETSRKSVYTDGRGLFKSYNISGSAFMIRRNRFFDVGFFDEYYFFCPEDIALSTKLNKSGYECYVNTDAEIIHKGGITTSGKHSVMQLATTPVEHKGAAHFFSGKSRLKKCTVSVLISMGCFAKGMKYILTGIRGGNDDRLYAKANFLASRYLLNSRSPKEIFEECMVRYVVPRTKGSCK